MFSVTANFLIPSKVGRFTLDDGVPCLEGIP